jgi:hypothetical protein
VSPLRDLSPKKKLTKHAFIETSELQVWKVHATFLRFDLVTHVNLSSFYWSLQMFHHYAFIMELKKQNTGVGLSCWFFGFEGFLSVKGLEWWLQWRMVLLQYP